MFVGVPNGWSDKQPFAVFYGAIVAFAVFLIAVLVVYFIPPKERSDT